MVNSAGSWNVNFVNMNTCDILVAYMKKYYHATLTSLVLHGN